jgi:hypothetical protein
MILAAQPDSFKCLLASMPLRIGMEISVTMTSGLECVAASNRDWPSDTLPTTSHVGFNKLSTMFRNGRWSSASRTRTFRNWSAYSMRGATIGLLRFSEGGARDIRFSPAADPGMIRAYSAEECLDSVNNTSGRTTDHRRKSHVFEDFMVCITSTVTGLFQMHIRLWRMTQNGSVC